MPANLREKLFTCEAIVLGRRDYGEADRILVLMTPTHGRLDVIAKGARKATSKTGTLLDLLMRVRIDLAKGRDLDVVRSVSPVSFRQHLRSDLDAFAHASYLADLVRTMLQPREEHRDIYDLLASSLELLENGVDPWAVTRHFELAFMSALGYRPQLLECVVCGSPLEAEPNAMSPLLGGMLCPRCRPRDPGALMMSINAQKYVRVMVRDGFAAAARFRPSDAERMEIQHATTQYVRMVAEREFRSLNVLPQLLTKRTPTQS